METRKEGDRSEVITVGASWLGLDGGQLDELIAGQLMDLGATITSRSSDRIVFHLDATATGLLRRAGLCLRNARRVSTNERALSRNRGGIDTNRRWLDAVWTALSVPSDAA